jgi:hypothetical protein
MAKLMQPVSGLTPQTRIPLQLPALPSYDYVVSRSRTIPLALHWRRQLPTWRQASAKLSVDEYDVLPEKAKLLESEFEPKPRELRRWRRELQDPRIEGA